MTILDEIIANKRLEVEERKKAVPISELNKSEFFSRQPISLAKAVANPDKSGIIAEFKKRSPSKGNINKTADAAITTKAYESAGASALSILTDSKFFGGSNDDLTRSREGNSCPILRKEFIIDEYQVLEAKAIGADAILLIAAALTPTQLKLLANIAHSHGLEVLMEVHDEHELLHNLGAAVDLIGVNNRNLRNFKVNVDVSRSLAPLIPNHVVKVSESGIESPTVIQELRTYGYKGFLMGQRFMEQGDPGKAATTFIQNLLSTKQS